MRILSLLLLMTALVTSCSSVRHVTSRNEVSFNSFARNKGATILYRSGLYRSADSVQLRDNTLIIWHHDKSVGKSSISDIQKVTLTINRIATGAKMWGIFVGGCVVGGAASVWTEGKNGEYALLGAIVGLIYGTILSPLAFYVGYSIGETVEYQFH